MWQDHVLDAHLKRGLSRLPYLQVNYSKNKLVYCHALQWPTHQLQNTGTFEWVPELPEEGKPIGSRIVFQLKQDGDGNITKYKACIIAKGFSQIPGQDFTDIFSSVAKFTILRTLLSIVAHKGWELHQVNVVAAYLQRD